MRQWTEASGAASQDTPFGPESRSKVHPGSFERAFVQPALAVVPVNTVFDSLRVTAVSYAIVLAALALSAADRVRTAHDALSRTSGLYRA
jgi:hypothetical protein